MEPSPSLKPPIDTVYTSRWLGKAASLIKDSAHHGDKLFQLVPEELNARMVHSKVWWQQGRSSSWVGCYVTSDFCIFFQMEEGRRENVQGAWDPELCWLHCWGSGKCIQSQWMGGWFAWWIGLHSRPFVVSCGLGQSKSHTKLWYNQKECFLWCICKVSESRSWHAKFP